MLDPNQNWRFYRLYEAKYTSYWALLTSHPLPILRTAAKTVVHIHDWWLLPNFLILGFFTLPGLFLYLRALRSERVVMAGGCGCLMASVLLQGADGAWRYLLPVFPFLAVISAQGLRLTKGLRIRHVNCGLQLHSWFLIISTCASLAYSARLMARFPDRPDSRESKCCHDAGVWLRSQAGQSDCLADTQSSIGYYAGIKTVDLLSVFGVDKPSQAEIAAKIRSAGCVWFAWVKGHSDPWYPGLTWLEQETLLAGCKLRFANEYVRLWRVDDSMLHPQ